MRDQMGLRPQLMTNSDLALYRAKQAGRGRVGVFNSRHVEEIREKQRSVDEVISAPERGEFEPYFQPQVDPRTGQVVGLEALARWRHPTRGVLTPASFLSIADNLSLVPKIDRMIFEKAIDRCGDLFRGDRSAPSLSFNVSTGRIKNDDLNEIGRLLPKYPGQVVFELLETISLRKKTPSFFCSSTYCARWVLRLRSMTLAQGALLSSPSSGSDQID